MTTASCTVRTAPGPSSIRAPHAGASEESTWSTRNAASMNDVDTDKHRQTLASEEGHHPLEDPPSKINLTETTCIMPMCVRHSGSLLLSTGRFEVAPAVGLP